MGVGLGVGLGGSDSGGGGIIDNGVENTQTTGLFLFTVVTNNARGYIIPIYINTTDTSRNEINAVIWEGEGKKMGITPIFDQQNGEFKVKIENSLIPLIQSVSFISTTKSGVIPQISSSISPTSAPISSPISAPISSPISAPISAPISQNYLVQYNYLVLGNLNTTKDIFLLYKIGVGPGTDIVNPSGNNIVMETPDYDSDLDGYGDLKNMALDNIEAMGYCTRRNQPPGM